MERNIQIDWRGIVQEAIKRRKEQKLTQEQLSVIAGVSKPTLVNFEKGRSTMKLESCFSILKVLGMLAKLD